jgi:hypothetical protein
MRRTYRLLYRMWLTPWGGGDMPAALVSAVTGPGALHAGVAVDLGCGTGAHARYLAGLGWTTTGIDFIPAAIATARRRDGAGKVTWRVADVTHLDEVDPGRTLAGSARLLLDVGCLHGLARADRLGWASTVAHLAEQTATLLVRAAPPGKRGIGPAGISAEEISTLLGLPGSRAPTVTPGTATTAAGTNEARAWP